MQVVQHDHDAMFRGELVALIEQEKTGPASTRTTNYVWEDFGGTREEVDVCIDEIVAAHSALTGQLENQKFYRKLMLLSLNFWQLLGPSSGMLGADDHEERDHILMKWMTEVEDLKEVFKRCDDGGEANIVENEKQKLKQLKRLHAYWALMTPENIPICVETLGSGCQQFMMCLCTQITTEMILIFKRGPEHNPEPKLSFSRIAKGRMQYGGRPLRSRIGEWDDVLETPSAQESDTEAEKEREKKLWNYLAPKHASEDLSCWQSFWGAGKVEIKFYWCGIPHLLDNDIALFKTIANLTEQTDESCAFSPIVSQSLLQQKWEVCQFWFMSENVLHSVAVLALMSVAMKTRAGALGNGHGAWYWNYVDLEHGRPEFYILFAVNTWCLIFHAAVEIFMAILEFRHSCQCLNPTKWVGPYGTWFNCLQIGFEVAVATQIWGLGMHILNHDETNAINAETHFVQSHPVIFASVILMKWVQLLMGLLCTRFFGLTVLPAVYAMGSSESIKFLLFLGLIWLMATHAYYILPLERGMYEGDPLKVSLVRMFRLCLLGDFDLWELEGIDPVVNFTDEPLDISQNQITGVTAVDEPAMGLGKIHNDIRWFSMGGTLVTAIVMMNMFIGVLGNAYEKYSERKVEMYHHYKAKYTLRCMLRQRFWLWLLRNTICSCCRGALDKCCGVKNRMYHEASTETDGIDSDEDHFRSPLDVDEDGDDGCARLLQLIRLQKDFLDENAEIQCGGFWTTIPTDLYSGGSNAGIEETVGGIAKSNQVVQEKIESLQDDVKKLTTILEKLAPPGTA